MSKESVLRLVFVLLGVFVCAVPSALIGFAFGIPLVRDWQIQRSIVLAEGSRYILDNTRQQTGNYQQKNLLYWNPGSISDIEKFYENLTVAPFLDVLSYDERWLIAAWNGSDIIKEPIRRSVSIHTDLCDYRVVFDCMSIALFDTNDVQLPNIINRLYSSYENEIQELPNNGTLIVFSYNIPDMS
jgi:hypothetical protein